MKKTLFAVVAGLLLGLPAACMHPGHHGGPGGAGLSEAPGLRLQVPSAAGLPKKDRLSQAVGLPEQTGLPPAPSAGAPAPSQVARRDKPPFPPFVKGGEGGCPDNGVKHTAHVVMTSETRH